jgi:cobalamin-dependent methionine synthase I
MAATGGKTIMDAVEDNQKANMTKAVVLDAAAGEIVDSALDYIMTLYSRELLRESKKLLGKRFSPGYGDLSLEIQKVIYDILNLEKLGITLTGSYMMIPQKSVIAITGII